MSNRHMTYLSLNERMSCTEHQVLSSKLQKNKLRQKQNPCGVYVIVKGPLLPSSFDFSQVILNTEQYSPTLQVAFCFSCVFFGVI